MIDNNFGSYEIIDKLSVSPYLVYAEKRKYTKNKITSEIQLKPVVANHVVTPLNENYNNNNMDIKNTLLSTIKKLALEIAYLKHQ